MITFTNEATNQMNDRLQEILLKRYALTKNQRYLTWLEQQSQTHTPTIDSSGIWICSNGLDAVWDLDD